LSRRLADACALVGFYRSVPKFSTGIRALMEADTAEVAVPATTVWEIAVKTAR
jgi:PIN domain nuclease of toxin-antitoxin system